MSKYKKNNLFDLVETASSQDLESSDSNHGDIEQLKNKIKDLSTEIRTLKEVIPEPQVLAPIQTQNKSPEKKDIPVVENKRRVKSSFIDQKFEDDMKDSEKSTTELVIKRTEKNIIKYDSSNTTPQITLSCNKNNHTNHTTSSCQCSTCSPYAKSPHVQSCHCEKSSSCHTEDQTPICSTCSPYQNTSNCEIHSTTHTCNETQTSASSSHNNTDTSESCDAPHNNDCDPQEYIKLKKYVDKRIMELIGQINSLDREVRYLKDVLFRRK